MRKILLTIVAMIATVCNVMAEEVLWSEDFSAYAKDDVPTGGAFSYACVGAGTKIYEDKMAGGTAPELLIAKNSGSFSATIAVNGITGELTLSYNANYDRISVTATGATVGEKVFIGTSATIPVTIEAGATSITLTFTNTNSSNVRFDNVKLAQGQGKKAAGLSWGTASRSVTLGSEGNVFPTLSNVYNLPVTYASDNTEVATIDASGNVTILTAGKANISATFEGNEEYEAQTVSYELTVKESIIGNTPETAYTTTEALALIEAGAGLDEAVYVKGAITKIDEVDTGDYGNATYYISDGTNELEIYRGYGLGGKKFTAADEIKVGDDLIVYGKLVDYKGTKEMTSGSKIYSINGVTGIKDITLDASSKVRKVITNGHIIIVAGNKTYTTAGQRAE